MAKTPEILLLGELALAARGALPASKKTRALLGFLAVNKASHTREELCDLLWQGPDDPRAALRWSLTKLRGVLGADAIEADRERVSLGKVTTDLDSVHGALAGGVETAPLERLLVARELFRGELLEGLLLPDCYRFHQWSTAEREKARALRIAVLTALTNRSQGDPERALAWARERVSVDPLVEGAHVEVIRLLTELGRKRDAVAQYDAFCRVLERELGARPSPALVEAKMKIGAASVAVPAPAPGRAEPVSARAPLPASPALPALVGRDTELGIIDRAARGDERGVLVVLGEPGIGKTRLLDELALRTRALGGTVLAGRAFEAEMVRPYGPWIDALASLNLERVPETLREALGALLPALGSTSGAAQNRGSLFDSVVALLVHLSESAGPVAVVLDDLQWCDEASLALLHYAARGVGSARVAIACGARPGELGDNPAALRLMRALARDGRSRAVELGPLGPDALAALARSVVTDADIERIVRDSSGNPLFALELARAAERGNESAGDSLAGLIGERIARLDEPAQELLGWAAALGRRFDLGTLESVTRTSPLEIGTRIAELERRGIVRASSDGTAYDFAHDLVRAAAYQRLSEPRRRGVHHFIARSLHALDDATGTRAGEVAHHAALAGDSELAARGALAAARRCLRMFAGAEAARLADFGIQQIRALPRVERLRFELSFLGVLVYSGAWVARVEPIKQALARAIAEAQDAGLHGELAEGLHDLSVLQFDRGDLGEAHGTTLRVAEAVGHADSVARARHLGGTARCLANLERDLDQAHRLYGEARSLAVEAGVCITNVEWAGAVLSAYGGDAERALEFFGKAIERARADGDRWEEYECLRGLVQIEVESVHPPAESKYCRELLELANKMGEGSAVPAANALDALLRLRRAEPGAEEAVEQAIVSLREVDAKGMLAYTLTLAAEADIESGQVEKAAERAREALKAASTVGRRTQMTLARALLARVALSRGDRDEGQSLFDAAKRDLAEPLAVSARAHSVVSRLAQAFDG